VFARRRTRILLVGPAPADTATIIDSLNVIDVTGIETITPECPVRVRRGRRVDLITCDLDELCDLGLKLPQFLSLCGPVDALVSVIDCSDPACVANARLQLTAALSSTELLRMPVLVFADRQDMPDAVPAWSVAEALGLHESGRPWSVQGCCRAEPDSVFVGLEWLVEACARRREAAVASVGPSGAPWKAIVRRHTQAWKLAYIRADAAMRSYTTCVK